MEATPVRIIEYFNGEKQSIVPLFQRPYTWVKKHWRALWQDVLAQYDAPDNTTHFMGAIVSVPARTVPVGVNKHLVIDGQQRLTTVALLLSALRTVADERTASRIEDYLINRHHEGVDRLKLLPTQGDRPAFGAVVAGNAPDPNHLMTQAHAFFQEQLRGLDNDGQPIDPQRLFTTLVSSLQVVMINLGESDDPYLIFESLNYKGEPLTQADLVRNYVLMRFRHALEPGGEQETTYLQVWKPLEDSLGTSLTEFLRHHGMKEGEDVRVGGIYSALKARFQRFATSGDLLAELREMRRFGRYYEMFLAPDRAPTDDIRRSLRTLLELEMTTAYPLLLRLFDAHERELLSDEALLRCLSMVESFSVRRSVCAVPTNAYNKLFLQWARNFSADRTAEWLADQMAAGAGGRRWPSDVEFRAALLSQPQYGKKCTRHILVSLEGSFGHREAATLTGATIEHVLPQTITDAWRAELGPDHAAAHGELTDTLGNLTLSAYNAELGNLPFADKKPRFAASHIELNRWICGQERWRRAEIEERARMLVNRALGLWPRPAQPGEQP